MNAPTITWHARIEYAGPVVTDDLAEAAEALAALSPALSMAQDGSRGSVAIYVDAATAPDAVGAALTAAAALLTGRDVIGVEVQTEEAFLAGLARPTVPEVVGYAEIADMTGLSRQRIRQLAHTDVRFPQPIIETAQGPLMPKLAVERWALARHAKAGRPRKAVTA